ncbi:hypothetical protein FA15DRAFT_605618, partial [Coprinopsis marcescibilis]
RPPSHGFDHIRGNTSQQQFSRPSNPEGVSGDSWVAQAGPNFVAPLKETCLG